MPHKTAQSHLRLHLLFLAAHGASGDIDLHVQAGCCTVIVPPRVPHDPDVAPIALGDFNLTREQTHVLEAVGAILQDAAREGVSGHVWVSVVAGVPQYPPASAFQDVLPTAPARQLPRRAPRPLPPYMAVAK